MKFAVADCTFAKDEAQGLAGSWLLWELQQAKIDPVPVPEADVILCTLNSITRLPTLRRMTRTAKKDAKVVVGGPSAYAPASFEQLADVFCVGEGVDFLRTLLQDGYDAACQRPEAWVPGESRQVTPGRTFPWEMPPVKRNDGAVQIFASRGCKKACLFCTEAWAAPFQQHPDPAVPLRHSQQLRQRGYRVAVGTNDAEYDSLELMRGTTAINVGLKGLRKALEMGIIGRKKCRTVRLGVDAISERLRAAVGKPLSNQQLVDITAELIAQKVTVQWFFIVGLPCENDDDYLEARDMIGLLHRTLAKGCVMSVFHSFDPHPSTPLGIFGIEDEYEGRFRAYYDWWARGIGFTPRQVLRKTSSAATRFKRALTYMGGSPEQVRAGWFENTNPNWRIKYRKTPAALRKVATAYRAKLAGAAGANA